MSAAENSPFLDALQSALAAMQIAVNPAAQDRLRAHYEAVIETNRVMNLTRITDPTEAAVKHYADSLALIPWAESRRLDTPHVLDVGTGAGFPAVPLAIARPDWSITAIDATGKKIRFLRQVVRDLGLSNLRCEHAHSAHWKTDQAFDIVAHRALANLNDSLTTTARHALPGGWIVAYKTAGIRDALADVAPMLPRLGLRSEGGFPYQLPHGDEVLDRTLVVFRKT